MQQQHQLQDSSAVHAPAAQGEQGGAPFFGALGFDYLGPVDGHDVQGLVAILQRLKVRV